MPAAGGGGDSGEEPATAAGPEAGDPATDKVAQLGTRGTLTLSTDLRYPPQSFAVKPAKRAPGSRCPANQLTAPQVAGYDADTGELVAKALGGEALLRQESGQSPPGIPRRTDDLLRREDASNAQALRLRRNEASGKPVLTRREFGEARPGCPDERDVDVRSEKERRACSWGSQHRRCGQRLLATCAGTSTVP